MNKLERSLQGISLDAPARIGATVFAKGVDVFLVIERAQREYDYQETIRNKVPALEEKPKTASDPWIKEMYKITTDYCTRTGKKVVIHDLLEMFFVNTLQQIDEEDRPLFERRLRERLA